MPPLRHPPKAAASAAKRAVSPQENLMATYRLFTRDPGDGPEDEWGWYLRLSGLTKWQVRTAIRMAFYHGYDDVSFLVERESYSNENGVIDPNLFWSLSDEASVPDGSLHS